ncbi:MAG: hypothetical protein ACLFQV_04495 [Vulcanimicrobiota bacterium]
MRSFTIEELDQLMDMKSEPSVTVYMSSLVDKSDPNYNRTHFKNLLREVEKRLPGDYSKEYYSSKLLKPAWELLEDSPYWNFMDQGFAMFLTPNYFQCYLLPINVQDLVTVSGHFHLKPLLELLSQNQDFYLLTISQNGNSFYKGNIFGVQEVKIDSMPASMAEVLRFDVPEESVQFHTSETHRIGQGKAIYHGQGIHFSDHKKDVKRYFDEINQALHNYMKNRKAPLILAGVDWLIPVYEDANTYKNLYHEYIRGNPEELTATDLHHKCRELLKPIVSEAKEKAMENFNNKINSDLTSKDLEEIVASAFFGKIDTLFVRVGEQVWGTFDSQKPGITIEEGQTYENQDLLDFAAVHTHRNGGRIFPIQPEELFEDSPVAAEFRFKAELVHVH